MEVSLDDIPVMFVKAEGGTTGAERAFHKLESGLASLRGRRFYGTYQAGEYRACVALLPNDDPETLGFETWVIPGGNYFREKLTNWSQRIPEIGKRFDAMAARISADFSRPSIEYYRTQSEVHLLLPMA
ncbi:MAG: hypothetical protein PVI78_09570 [Anaerolineales bacterium]|jgi:hypothetical protein